MGKILLSCYILLLMSSFVGSLTYGEDGPDDPSPAGLVELVTVPVRGLVSPVIDLGEIVITPGRTHEYVFNVNRNVSVITGKDIQNANATGFREMLEREPGVAASGFFGNVKDNNIDIRGYGETGLLNYVALVDGRRTNQIDLSGPDLAQVDINSIERIEVIRGPNSVLYGDNATGGVINIITKKGEKGDRIRYTQEYGSYTSLKEYLSAEGDHEFLDYFASYSYQDTQGYRINNGYEANDVFSSVTMRPGEIMEVVLSASYHRDWYGMPGSLFLRNMQTDGRRHARFPDTRVKTEDYYMSIEPRFFGEVFLLGEQEGVLSVPATFRSRRKNLRDVSFNVYKVDDHIISWDIRPKVEVNSEFMDGALQNKIVFGVDYFYAKDRITSGDITVTPSRVNIEKQTLGVYLSDNMLIDDRFIINGGVRGEWAEYVFGQTTPSSFDDVRYLREIAFNGSIGYKYNETSQVYFNYARAYRYPTTDEFFTSAFEYVDFFGNPQVVAASLNAGIKQQVGNNYEIGIKDDTFDIVNLEAAYFVTQNKNEIFFDPASFMNRNYHCVLHHGLELKAHGDLGDKAEAFCSYTFQKVFYVGGDYAGNTVPLVPNNKISIGVDASPLEQLSLNCVMNYTGSRYLASDQANARGKLKQYFTVDAGIAFELDNFRLYASIKNIFDQEYFDYGSFSPWAGDSFYPAGGRSLEAGVTIMF